MRKAHFKILYCVTGQDKKRWLLLQSTDGEGLNKAPYKEGTLLDDPSQSLYYSNVTYLLEERSIKRINFLFTRL